MKKVAFKYWPREATPKDHFFKNILKEKFKVHFTSVKEADVIFFSIFDGTNKREIPEFEFNGTKVFFTGENVKVDMKKCTFGFGFDYEEKIKNKNYLRLPLYTYYGAGKDLIKPKNYNPKKILKSKTKFCNYVYSKDAKKRVEFFKELSKYKLIDAPGKSNNNSLPIPSNKLKLITSAVRKIESINKKYVISSLIQRHFGNWREEIINYQKNYKFSIAFENESSIGYTTEKIYHPMLANSIPIYYGNPEISRDFNTKSFVNYHDYNDTKKVVDIVMDLDQNEKKYLSMLKQPWLKKNKINKWMDKKRIEKQLALILK